MNTTLATTITADPDLPAIRITREFDAPPAAVYRAHVDPDLVVRWLGPRRLTMTIQRSMLVPATEARRRNAAPSRSVIARCTSLAKASSEIGSGGRWAVWRRGAGRGFD